MWLYESGNICKCKVCYDVCDPCKLISLPTTMKVMLSAIPDGVTHVTLFALWRWENECVSLFLVVA